MTPKEREELRELQDPDSWDWEQGEVHGPAVNPTAVVSIRFTREEFERVATAAERSGRKLTQYVHDAALAQVDAQPAGR
jgi:hypothetical protein